MGLEDEVVGSGISKSRRAFFWQLPLFIELLYSAACRRSDRGSTKGENKLSAQTSEKPISIQQKLDRYFLGLNVEELGKYDEYFRVPDKQKIYEMSDKVGIDPLLVFAIMKQESDFNPNALSSKQAYGYMQVTKIAHEEIYRLLFDQDPYYQTKRERIQTRDNGRLEAIREITDGLFDDPAIQSLFSQKGSKRNKRLNKEITRRINLLFQSYCTRGDVENDSLIPIGISYLALADTELRSNIELVISSYNQGIERTQKNHRPMSNETRNYLRHINENHPTFKEIYGKLIKLGKTHDLDLEDIEEGYYNFKTRLLNSGSPNPDLFVYHQDDRNLPGIVYQIENGETPDSIGKTSKFKRYAVTENFARFNPGIDPKKLKPRDFVIIPLIPKELTQPEVEHVQAPLAGKKSKEERFYEIAEGDGYLYRGKNSEGKAIYRHRVKPGETLHSIAESFNRADDTHFNIYSCATTHNIRTRRNGQIDYIYPKQEVYIVISKR